MTTVDLLVPELEPYDATSTHSRLLRDLLVEYGATVRLVTQRTASVDESVTLLRHWRDPADTVILQHGIGSLLADAVIKRRLPVVVNYHNITPLEFVEPWDPDHIAGLRWGRSQLLQLAVLARRALAVSQFNAAELLDAGFRDVRVAPVLWNSGPVAERTTSVAPSIVFVGRVAANKCHHDLIAALAALHTTHATARLTIVGGDASTSYRRALGAYVRRLGMDDRVEFVGGVGDDELAALLARADVFLCLSEHEGFCVPVVEAMAAGVPVVAYGAAALPETVADAGIVLGDKAPETIAVALRRVLDDTELATALAERGRRRAADFSLERSRSATLAALEGLVAP